MAKANTKTATTKTVQRATILKSAPRDKKEKVLSFLEKQDAIALLVIEAASAIETHNLDGLGKWLTLGNALKTYQTNWVANGGSLNARATKKAPLASWLAYWKASAFSYLDENSVSDALFIANNWDKVATESKKDLEGKLAGLESGSVKDKINKQLNKQAGGKAQGPANKNTSKKNKPVTAQSIVDTALATATKHDVSIADVLKTLKATLEKAIKKS